MQEKRRHPRIAIRLPISCEVAGDTPFLAMAQDVSIGGLFVQATSSPPFGTQVTLIADFPGTPAVRLVGVVRWTKPDGFGVQFGLLGARETHALAGLLRSSS